VVRPPARVRRAGLTDWHQRHPDIVRLSGDTYLPSAASTELRTRLHAILLTAPDGAVVSHHTAATMWRTEIPLEPGDPPVHLTVPPTSRARNRRDRRLHRGHLPPDDVVRWWSLPW
jgi:hypothetical protein